ncbi:hypothetical protein A7K69_02720 [Parageobacillus thermoglucosidasius]|uniref:Uncharacterized protein n=1 Tax=Parageobacillus thermoglucosidasius TaxID=1426 RepID=A0A1B7KX94_PARTM|nr:hypothetical protein A7K69_02720 [Parageobacillus thermoglucosidasius]
MKRFAWRIYIVFFGLIAVAIVSLFSNYMFGKSRCNNKMFRRDVLYACRARLRFNVFDIFAWIFFYFPFSRQEIEKHF